MKEKKWFSRSKSMKNLKEESKPSTRTLLERRWSAITQPNNLKKTKKRNSFAATSKKDQTHPEPDYIRVPKTEYEAIKNRVSAMERRISQELESVQLKINTENENNINEDDNILNVQTAYEQTLVQSKLSPTADQLAKRLSRELKIRRSAEQKIIRSPSARKIGSMRRKSLEKNNVKLGRHQSWHVAPRESIPRVSLRRGKPNTIQTGLPTLEHKEIRRTSSVGEQTTKSISCNLSGSSSDTWVSAEGFFETLKSNNSSNFNDRASLARLRSQNAGMVLAKAKLFDKLTDSDSSGSSNLPRSLPRPKVGTKIGACRTADSRLSYRVRSLKCEERRIGKKSMSPRRQKLTQKQKLQIAKQCLDASGEGSSNKENIPDLSTPRVPPHIKRTLNVRSPKRLCRTPGGLERSTPLRALI